MPPKRYPLELMEIWYGKLVADGLGCTRICDTMEPQNKNRPADRPSK